MALIDEANLAAQHRKAAKFRTNHVGTKLNEAELREFDALAEKRQQSPSELIRGLVLREIERDKQPAPELRQAWRWRRSRRCGCCSSTCCRSWQWATR
jgi:hypothetical protein